MIMTAMCVPNAALHLFVSFLCLPEQHLSGFFIHISEEGKLKVVR